MYSRFQYLCCHCWDNRNWTYSRPWTTSKPINIVQGSHQKPAAARQACFPRSSADATFVDEEKLKNVRTWCTNENPIRAICDVTSITLDQSQPQRYFISISFLVLMVDTFPRRLQLRTTITYFLPSPHLLTSRTLRMELFLVVVSTTTLSHQQPNTNTTSYCLCNPFLPLSVTCNDNYFVTVEPNVQ